MPFLLFFPKVSTVVINTNLRKIGLVSLAFVVLLFAYWKKHVDERGDTYKSDVVPALSNDRVFEASLLPATGQLASHAPFIAETPEGDQLVFWFSGSKEGERDVQIYRTKLRAGRVIEGAEAVLSPEMLSKKSKRFIKNIGNPVVWYQGDRLILAVVNVSVGGWATARVDMLSSADHGLTFEYEGSLRTSPFFNISTLIRTRPLISKQGSVLIPAYFELGRLNPMMLHLDESLKLQYSKTLPVRAIQSALIDQGDHLRLISRPMGQGSLQVVDYDPVLRTSLAGSETSLSDPNASSAVSIVRTSSRVLLMAHNPGENRKRLALSVSRDGGLSWSVLFELPNEEAASLAYPSLLLDQEGVLHLTYSESKKAIHYVRFTLAGLANRLEEIE